MRTWGPGLASFRILREAAASRSASFRILREAAASRSASFRILREAARRVLLREAARLRA